MLIISTKVLWKRPIGFLRESTLILTMVMCRESRHESILLFTSKVRPCSLLMIMALAISAALCWHENDDGDMLFNMSCNIRPFMLKWWTTGMFSLFIVLRWTENLTDRQSLVYSMYIASWISCKCIGRYASEGLVNVNGSWWTLADGVLFHLWHICRYSSCRIWYCPDDVVICQLCI